MAPLPRSFRAPRPRGRRAFCPWPEALEVRWTPAAPSLAGIAESAAAAVVMQPILQEGPAPISTPATSPAAGPTVRPLAWNMDTPWGLTPQQVRTAYGFNQVAFQGISGDGTGQTIAIVDAYDDPGLVDSSDAGFGSSDLARFDQQFGLADPPSFIKLNESGSSTHLPGTDPAGAGTSGNWEEEEALDAEWVHALAPGAGIIVVESQGNDGSDLYRAAMTAAGLPGVSVVVMSWGAGEYNGQQSFDNDFTTPSGHPGVTFVAAAGDAGSPGLYPAYSPNVVAVGGTTLNVQGDNAYGGETAWSGSGGGTSTSEAEPAYQGRVQDTGMRTIPDVSFDADPSTGVSVYDSYNDTNGDGPWKQIGGTSLAAPAWAAVLAVADQGRWIRGGATLDGPSQTLRALYALPADDFHDITSGSNGGFSAGPGYNEVTGLGTPRADLIIPDLASYGIAGRLVVTAQPPSAVTAGNPFGLTVEVEDSEGSVETSYMGTVTVALASNPGNGTLGGTLTVTAHQGVATFSDLTLDTVAAGYTLVITTSGPAAATTLPIDVTPGAAARLVVAAAPRAHGLSLVVTIEDAFGNVETGFDGVVIVAPASGSRKGLPHGRIAVTAGQGVATFSHSRAIKQGRGSALRATADGLTATTTLGSDGSTTRAKSRTEQARLLGVRSKPTPRHAGHAVRPRAHH